MRPKKNIIEKGWKKIDTPSLNNFFGKAKNWKKSTQQIKDELRRELYD